MINPSAKRLHPVLGRGCCLLVQDYLKGSLVHQRHALVAVLFTESLQDRTTVLLRRCGQPLFEAGRLVVANNRGVYGPGLGSACPGRGPLPFAIERLLACRHEFGGPWSGGAFPGLTLAVWKRFDTTKTRTGHSALGFRYENQRIFVPISRARLTRASEQSWNRHSSVRVAVSA